MPQIKKNNFMNQTTFQAIVTGTPGVIVQVAAADLKAVVADMVKSERDIITEAIEAHREKPTMSRHQAAKALGVTLSTLWRWAKEGYLVPVKIGTKVLYRATDIDKMLETNLDARK